jgi:uncharacterized protein YlxP (DUF503 family)
MRHRKYISMNVGVSVIQLYLPGSHSLKAKRSVVKSLTARIHREFNVSCSEVEHHDVWQSAALGVAMVSNDPAHIQQVMAHILSWIERNRPDVEIMDQSVEIFHSAS